MELTNSERVLFPDIGLTKQGLADYYVAVADVLVPHLADRPLMLQRFPEGIERDGFYQKEAGRGVPSWLRTVEVAKSDGTVNHPVVDDTRSLLALTNLSTISLHRWASRADRLEHPDLLIVDLDPSAEDFADVRRAALHTKQVLDELDLLAYVQVTGSRGVHVVSPIERSATTDAVGAFAGAIAALLAARHPEELTTEFRKRSRGRRVYVDVARNGWAQTAIAPYSVRPRPGAPVATPITWDELDDPELRPDGFSTRTVPERIAEVGDPWAGMGRRARSLERRAGLLRELLAEEGH